MKLSYFAPLTLGSALPSLVGRGVQRNELAKILLRPSVA